MMDAERKAEIRTRCDSVATSTLSRISRVEVRNAKLQFNRICDIEDPSVQSHAAAISYSIVVPDLLAAIDELEVRNAKLEVRNAKLEAAVAKVCREHVHGHSANCPGEMCKSLDALDALNHQ
jgi:hypothetical protein